MKSQQCIAAYPAYAQFPEWQHHHHRIFPSHSQRLIKLIIMLSAPNTNIFQHNVLFTSLPSGVRCSKSARRTWLVPQLVGNPTFFFLTVNQLMETEANALVPIRRYNPQRVSSRDHFSTVDFIELSSSANGAALMVVKANLALEPNKFSVFPTTCHVVGASPSPMPEKCVGGMFMRESSSIVDDGTRDFHNNYSYAERMFRLAAILTMVQSFLNLRPRFCWRRVCAQNQGCQMRRYGVIR